MPFYARGQNFQNKGRMLSVPKTAAENQPLLIQALQGKATDRVPFWFMRQAGRYLPEYRALREQAGSFLKLAFTPELAAEVTLQPIRRFGMDAAILFSDILVIPYALGQQLDFVEGEGPRLGPIDVGSFSFDAAKLDPVLEALRLVRRQLSPDKALIGFAGAPWTLACYMIQGRGDGAFEGVRKAAMADPEKFDAFIGLLANVTILYLSSQIDNGADAVQIFDSWAGLLPDPWFSRWVVAPAKHIVETLKRLHPETPVIGFPRQAGALHGLYARATGVNGIGIDQGVTMEQAVKDVPPNVCLQGNLAPELLLQGGDAMRDGALKILRATAGRPFIFNLGHGVIKETPPEHVAELSAVVRDFRR